MRNNHRHQFYEEKFPLLLSGDALLLANSLLIHFVAQLDLALLSWSSGLGSSSQNYVRLWNHFQWLRLDNEEAMPILSKEMNIVSTLINEWWLLKTENTTFFFPPRRFYTSFSGNRNPQSSLEKLSSLDWELPQKNKVIRNSLVHPSIGVTRVRDTHGDNRGKPSFFLSSNVICRIANS